MCVSPRSSRGCLRTCSCARTTRPSAAKWIERPAGGGGGGGEPLVSAETEEKGLDAEKAKQICTALLLYAHGMAAMQATGRTAFTRQQIETNMHAMHEMLLAQTK